MAVEVTVPMGAAATHRAVRVLGYMIGHDPVREEVVARGLGLSVEDVRETLVALERDRLVERSAGGLPDAGAHGGRWTALPPQALLTALLARRAPDAAGWPKDLDVPDEPRPLSPWPEDGAPIDVVSGTEQVGTVLRGLRVMAARELLYLVTPSFPPAVGRPRGGDAAVTTRAVHEMSVPPTTTPAHGRPGVRLAPHLPIGLMVVDRSIAILPSAGGAADGPDEVLVVHAPPVVEALVEVFEREWREAVPPPGRRPPAAGERRRRVLAMMAAGLTDDAIARALGVGTTDVEEELATLAGELGARTRFQLALLAARQGLV